ncbi:UNVERIFIED_ORG: formiminoglutamase [Kosakonia oryzae]|uniref:Formiminoglutamase n=1 Tax=Kosakonia radicincitans TaxID=283686 RepID=A0AAX2ETI6_9ENTR|nr:N-formylglutamate deformylase [Kosakonia radicincitans]MDP9565564.1 formiminoglutamase [Kosakonia oryzae]SFE30907.1 formiminoglutamase [Kosakonia radicincitans]SFR16947.1 formiminoglutamase [Kosakonia radicincitans]SFT77756.1 formiminoglutamase [Kosakonia radicincitans]SFX60979.1 formiminoglutamase [Kosakonia radicincitans]
MTNGFELHQGRLPLLVSMPHPGTHLTPEIARGLTARAQRLEDTDWHIPLLYQPIRELGASVLSARYSRYVVDLNRPADDKPLYSTATTGLFPGIFFDGEPLFEAGKAPDDATKAAILHNVWQPYHQALAQELARLRDTFGYALLWDAHSIKSVVPRLFEGKLPDLNFGTADGASCAPELSRALLDCCEAFPHYSKVLNGRFKGGYITRHYGAPQQNIHAVQLEVAQCCYMDETSFAFCEEKSERFRELLSALINTALAWGEQNLSR